MASKRQHKENKLNLKYEALLELEKGKTNKEVSNFFNVPPKELSFENFQASDGWLDKWKKNLVNFFLSHFIF